VGSSWVLFGVLCVPYASVSSSLQFLFVSDVYLCYRTLRSESVSPVLSFVSCVCLVSRFTGKEWTRFFLLLVHRDNFTRLTWEEILRRLCEGIWR
jgi:hypothetical protein